MSPADVARTVRTGGGVLGLIGAALLLLRGQVVIAAALAGMAASFAGWRKLGQWASFRWPASGAAPSAGRVTTARSAMLEMRLDHDSGAMTGAALSGTFAGRSLDTLSRPELLSLSEELHRDDPDGVALLETYLDRRFAGWREADQGQGQRRGTAGSSGAMSRREAYETSGPAGRRRPRGNYWRASRFDEEASSRSRRFDRACRAGQSSQGCFDAAARLGRSPGDGVGSDREARGQSREAKQAKPLLLSDRQADSAEACSRPAKRAR